MTESSLSNTPEAHSAEVAPVDSADNAAPENSARVGVLARPGVRQLVKFCIVGASSTVIDKSLQWVLMSLGQSYAPGVPWWFWQSVSFCVAVSNGYIWNRRWTFQASDTSREVARAQYFKFLVTNFIGWMLNLGFTKLFLVAFTGQAKHTVEEHKMQIMIASLCAVPIVVVWNFSAAKFWTFRTKKVES